MKILFVIIFNFLQIQVFAQINRYIVSFANKDNSSYSVNRPEEFLSQRALERRHKNNVTVNTDDLPVNNYYVQQVGNIEGVKTFFTSRWFNAVLVECKNEHLDLIENLPFVTGTIFVAPGSKLGESTPTENYPQNSTAVSIWSSKINQLKLIGLDVMQSDGYLGNNVIISVLDAGFINVNTLPSFQHIFSEDRVLLTKDFIQNSGNVYQFDSHGTSVLSIMVGKVQDKYLGGAPKSKIMLFVTEDVTTEYKIEEYNWLFAAEKADSAGTDIIQSSLGYSTFDDPTMNYSYQDLDGKTAVISKAASMARDRGIIVVNSAGNDGRDINHNVSYPADVDGILTVGSIDVYVERSLFSSFGRTYDNRIKPDVCTNGEEVTTVNKNGVLRVGSGTSYSSPLIASLVAGLIEAYPKMGAAELIERIKITSSRGLNPNNEIGYGVPSYMSFKNNDSCQDCLEDYLNSVRTSARIFDNSKDQIRITPNPVHSKLSVIFRNPSNEKTNFIVYNLNGSVVANYLFSLSMPDNSVEISMDNLSYGYYILKVKNSTIDQIFRFINY